MISAKFTTLYLNPIYNRLLSYKNILWIKLFKCLFISFLGGSNYLASSLIDQGISEFNQGNFLEAKTSFKLARHKSSTISLKHTLTAQSYLFAITSSLNLTHTQAKIIKKTLHKAYKLDAISTECFKTFVTKLILYSPTSTSSERATSLRYLKRQSHKVPFAAYLLGQYLEKTEQLSLRSAKAVYIKTSSCFEASKKNVLSLRRSEIKKHIKKVVKRIHSFDIKRVCNDLDFRLTSEYLDYDVAALFSLLLSTDLTSNICKLYYLCLQHLANEGSYLARAFCYIYGKATWSENKSLDLTIEESIKQNLLRKAQSNDPLYLSGYALYKLYSLHIISLSHAELTKAEESLTKLKSLAFAPAVYERYQFDFNRKNNSNSNKTLGIGANAVIGDAKSQYVLAMNYLVKSKCDVSLINKGLYWLELSAKKSNLPALEHLGEFYIKGEYVKRNLEKAVYWLAKASEKGSVKASYLLGEIYLMRGEEYFDVDLSLKYLKKAAEKFYPPAVNLLGEIYYNGTYLHKNYELALKYFAIGLEWKYSKSIYNLAWMVQRGRGTTKDEELATNIFQHAAELGDLGAQHHVAWRYMLGIGTSKDLSKAIHWMTKAANDGYIKSCYTLGKLYYWGDNKIPQNLTLSTEYYTISAFQGCNLSQYYLGCAYKKGLGVAQNDKIAAYWFLKAAKQGHTKAAYEIALSYLWGVGKTKNLDQAFIWFKKAAYLNCFPAYYQLGNMYFFGLGTDECIEKAIYWYKKASDLGDVEAHNILAWVCFHNVQSFSRGFNYAKLASNENYPQGLFLNSAINIYLDVNQSNRKKLLKLEVINKSIVFNPQYTDYSAFMKTLERNYTFSTNLPLNFFQNSFSLKSLKSKFIRASKLF